MPLKLSSAINPHWTLGSTLGLMGRSGTNLLQDNRTPDAVTGVKQEVNGGVCTVAREKVEANHTSPYCGL